MPQAARRAPDTTVAREALYRALRLLDDQGNPHALAEAREAARTAADAVPYPWQARHCASTGATRRKTPAAAAPAPAVLRSGPATPCRPTITDQQAFGAVPTAPARPLS